jgi:hypothetical protein
MARNPGWYNESNRHALAAKGIKTGNKVNASLPMGMAKPKATKPANAYTAYGEVYNVKERFDDAGMPTKDIDPNWYEYEVTLEDANGNEIDSWDSYDETYNGMQTLSKKLATKSMQEILDDVEKGKVASWFNVNKR